VIVRTSDAKEHREHVEEVVISCCSNEHHQFHLKKSGNCPRNSQREDEEGSHRQLEEERSSDRESEHCVRKTVRVPRQGQRKALRLKVVVESREAPPGGTVAEEFQQTAGDHQSEEMGPAEWGAGSMCRLFLNKSKFRGLSPIRVAITPASRRRMSHWNDMKVCPTLKIDRYPTNSCARTRLFDVYPNVTSSASSPQ